MTTPMTAKKPSALVRLRRERGAETARADKAERALAAMTTKCDARDEALSTMVEAVQCFGVSLNEWRDTVRSVAVVLFQDFKQDDDVASCVMAQALASLQPSMDYHAESIKRANKAVDDANSREATASDA